MNEFLFMKILKMVMLLLKIASVSEVVDLYKLQGEINMIL
jgi:hypothetical protein